VGVACFIVRALSLCSAVTGQQYFSFTSNQHQPPTLASPQYFSLITISTSDQPQPAERERERMGRWRMKGGARR